MDFGFKIIFNDRLLLFAGPVLYLREAFETKQSKYLLFFLAKSLLFYFFGWASAVNTTAMLVSDIRYYITTSSSQSWWLRLSTSCIRSGDRAPVPPSLLSIFLYEAQISMYNVMEGKLGEPKQRPNMLESPVLCTGCYT